MQIKTILRVPLSQLEWPSSTAKTTTKQQMLVKMQRNSNLYTLVGMEISPTIMESNMEIPLKAKCK
jgi:hypothetical protein